MSLPDDLLNPLEGLAPLTHCAMSETPGSSSSKKRAGESVNINILPQKKRRLLSSKSGFLIEFTESDLQAQPLTHKQQGRREKLLNDKHANILSPFLVECNRCGSAIKLAGRDPYDPHHWMSHSARCARWPEAKRAEMRAAKTAMKRGESSTDASRLSTPPLTPDDGSEGTRTRAQSEMSLASHSPPPSGASGKTVSNGPARPRTSHIECARYMALGYHPDAECVDLEASFPEIPQWTFDNLKLPIFVDEEEAETESGGLTLSTALWPEEQAQGTRPQHYTFPMPSPQDNRVQQ